MAFSHFIFPLIIMLAFNDNLSFNLPYLALKLYLHYFLNFVLSTSSKLVNSHLKFVFSECKLWSMQTANILFEERWKKPSLFIFPSITYNFSGAKLQTWSYYKLYFLLIKNFGGFPTLDFWFHQILKKKT